MKTTAGKSAFYIRGQRAFNLGLPIQAVNKTNGWPRWAIRSWMIGFEDAQWSGIRAKTHQWPTSKVFEEAYK